MATASLRLRLPPTWQRFWHWWTSQLAGLVPDSIKQMLATETRRYLSFSDPDKIQIWEINDQREISKDGAIRLDEIAFAQQDNPADANPPVTSILLLTPGQYLLKRLKLPAAAEENLHQVITFELDRQTPFQPEQVYFAEQIINRPPQSSKLVVDLILVKKDFLDDKLSLLKAAGVHPSHVDGAIMENELPRPLGFELLPPQWQIRQSRRQQIVNLTLATALFALLALALTLPLIRQQKTIAKLEGQIAEVRNQAKTVNELKQKVETLTVESRFALTKKQARPPLIQVMEDLSQRIPEDTWLTSFRYQKGQLMLDGQSPAASKLIELLEDSPYLKNLHFISPITQDPTTGLERFRISMDVAYENAPDTTD